MTYAASIHVVRVLGGEIGTAVIQRLVAVREQFHSNVIGLHVDASSWLTDERLGQLTGGVFPGSSGMDDAHAWAAQLLGEQVKAQAFTLAYIDAFKAVALVAGMAMLLIALMKGMKIYFGPNSGTASS